MTSQSNHILTSFFHTLPLGVVRLAPQVSGSVDWGLVIEAELLLGPEAAAPCFAEQVSTDLQNWGVAGGPRDKKLAFPLLAHRARPGALPSGTEALDHGLHGDWVSPDTLTAVWVPGYGCCLVVSGDSEKSGPSP